MSKKHKKKYHEKAKKDPPHKTRKEYNTNKKLIPNTITINPPQNQNYQTPLLPLIQMKKSLYIVLFTQMSYRH